MTKERVAEEKKGNGITELVFILDKSGSMAGMESDTVGGFNSMIDKQKNGEGEVLVSTVLFSNYSEVLHDRKPLKEIEPLTEKDYFVGGGTALLDAIGGAIHHIGNIHKYARPEDVPEHTIFIITTDGYENASMQYGSEKVKKMISRQEKEFGWEFLFVAANIDAVEAAERIGIRADRAACYDVQNDTDILFDEMSETICAFREKGTIRKDWAKKIEAGSKSKTPKKPKK